LFLGLAVASFAYAKEKERRAESKLTDYLARARRASVAPRTTGSLWVPHGPYADLATDYKALSVNDIIVIRIVEQTRAEAEGSLKSSRRFAASSGISGLMGPVGTRSGLQTLFSPSSDRGLEGQAQTASSSRLSTSLAGHVVEVLPNGNLVVEAAREVEMNHQRQTLVVRGVVRPGDIAADNSVLSSAIGNLEIELKGRGVITDNVRPPNRIVRILLKILGF